MTGGAVEEMVESEPKRQASTILVVDDDAAVRRVAAKVLRRSGYDVLEAATGQEALDLVETRGGEDVDFLLTDVVMPGMSGRELSERLREIIPDLPILFMSAYTEDEVILQGVRVAEVNFLSKPFTLDELVSTVEKVMSRAKA